MKSMDAFKKYLVKRKTVKSAVQAAVAPVSAEKKEKTRNKARFLSVSPSIQSSLTYGDESAKSPGLDNSSTMGGTEDLNMPPLILLGKTAYHFHGVVTKETGQEIADKRIENAIET